MEEEYLYWRLAKVMNYDLEKLNGYSIEEFDKINAFEDMNRDIQTAQSEMQNNQE